MVEEPTNGDIKNDKILSIDSENFENSFYRRKQKQKMEDGNVTKWALCSC
jgi:hypothetical protein